MSEESGFKKFIAIIMIVVVIVVVGATVWSAARTVPSGYVGILINWEQPIAVLEPGFHWISPIGQDIVLMNTQILKVETEEGAASSDLQVVTTQVAVNYRLQPQYIIDIYKDLRQDWEARVMLPNIQESLKAATAEYQATELIANRESVKTTFLNILDDRLNIYHIDVLSVSVTNFQFSPEFDAAIEAKVTAEQRALEAQNKLKQIEYEAQQQVIQASANATAIVTLAQANANSTIIAANATAEATRIIQVQLTPEYIQYLATIGWNGQLPIYWGANGMSFILLPTTNSTITP